MAEIASGWTTQPGFPLVKVTALREDGRTALAFAQERFAIHQKNPEPLTWKIPLSFTQAAVGTKAHAILLGDMPSPASLAGTAAIKANVVGSGYYRVQYDPALYADLVN